MTPEDRILHYALGRVLGGVERVDLTQRIVRAWERGAASAPEPAVVREQPTAVHGRPHPWWRWVTSAAAVLAAAGLVWWAARPDAPGDSGTTAVVASVPAPAPSPRILAQADGALEPFDEPGGAALRSLAAGQRVIVPAGRTVTLALSSAAVLSARPGTVFSLESSPAGAGPRVLLEAGGLELSTPAVGGGPASIEVGFAALHVDAGSLVLAQVESDDPDAEWSSEDLARSSRGHAELPRLLSIEVASGAARLVTADGERALFERGAMALSNVPDKLSLASIERRWIDEHLLLASRNPERLGADSGGAGSTDLAVGAAARAATELFEFIEARPTRWVLLQEVALEALAQPPPWYGKSVLETLAAAPHPRAFDTARALWRARPEAFSSELLLALADRGGFEFERELRAQVAAWSPGDELPVLAAIWLARRHDDRGLEILKQASLLPPDEPAKVLGQLQAALALEDLGETAFVEPTCAQVARAGLELLADGRVDVAGQMAAALELFDTARAAGTHLALTDFRGQLDLHMNAAGARFSDADRVRTLLAGFLPD